MSYEYGVRFPIPNSKEQTLAPDTGDHKCRDSNFVSVPLSCIGASKCGMPKQMYTGTDSLGVCGGHAYGLVSSADEAASCDWTLDKPRKEGRAVMIGLDETQGCSGVIQNTTGLVVPVSMAIWVR